MFKEKTIKTIKLLLIVGVSILFMETVFRFSALDIGLTPAYLRVALFSLAYASFVVLILKMFPPLGAKVAFTVSMLLLSIVYFSQHLYYSVMGGFFSVHLLGDAGQGTDFIHYIVNYITVTHFLYVIPGVLSVWFIIKTDRKGSIFDTRYENLRVPIYTTLFALVMIALSVSTISTTPLADDEDHYYTDKDFYEENISPHLSINRFGLLTYARRDIQNLYGDPVEDDSDKDEILEEFLDNRRPHVENEMTGMFEDKNFIMIKAESLDHFGVDPDLMPNYTEMLENSLIFDDFYAPLYYRNTSDSEFMTHTSLYPTSAVNMSMKAYMDNHFPNTLPRMFEERDYATRAHHNYTDLYYPRSEFHPGALGFDEYVGAEDMGLIDPDEYENEQPPWPSDLDMFKKTLDDVFENDQFFAYYLSVTGHLPYDETHDIAEENYDTIVEIFEENDRELPEEEALTYFHAAHYEFDLALGYLMDRLEEEGLKDDTVIMVVSDHYPYGLDSGTIEGYETDKHMDESRLNIHNVPMSIYHPDLEQAHFEDVLSNIDLMPTIANLFNLDIEYDKILGYDYFSPNTSSTVFFQDTSFLTDHYLMAVNEDMDVVKRYTDVHLEVVDTHYNYLIHKRQMNLYLLETDYFGRLEEEDE